MQLISILSLLAIWAFIACNPNRVYETHHKDFPDYRWDKSKKLEFTPEITDTAGKYRLYLALRHVYGFQFASMRVKVTSVSPSGKIVSKNYEFPVFASEDKYLSDCAEDICDLESVVEENMKFDEAGGHKYIVEHEMPADSLPNVMEFGLIIEKHPQDK